MRAAHRASRERAARQPVSGPPVLVHVDEACLGNGTDPPNPGGAGGLVEMEHKGVIVRRDYFLAVPDTTNNRMALFSAIAGLELLGARGHRLLVTFVSDSTYLIKGMNEWVDAWKRKDWKRREGKKLVDPENLELWRRLDVLRGRHDITWKWVRGHAGHAKNEYANLLATRAAAHQKSADTLVESGFLEWLAQEREKGKYLKYDPDDLTP